MNDDTIADLKQFIAVTISQQTNDLEVRFNNFEDRFNNMEDRFNNMEKHIDTVEQNLTQKIDDLSTFVGEALETTNNVTGTQLKNHETRITKLEQSRA